ncbi:MAG: hypothetical protein JWP88_2070 [Flaviaesturariibacter sp.]|nr:hypothetical protein [Flaviaesturariibacter sp.]
MAQIKGKDLIIDESIMLKTSVFICEQQTYLKFFSDVNG